MSFAAGFFGTLANNMQSKREFIRGRVEEDRKYLRAEGLKRSSEISKQRGVYQTAAEHLIRKGADEAKVLALLEADPDGVRDLASLDDIPNSSVLESMIELSEGHVATGGSISEVLDSIMPTVTSLPKDVDPTTARRKTFASWMGLDTQEELQSEVYSSRIVGDMTGDQILASMNIPVRAKGTGVGASIDYDAMEANQPLNSRVVTDTFNDILRNYSDSIDRELKEIVVLKNTEGFDMNSAAGQNLKDREERLKALSDVEGSPGSKVAQLIEAEGPNSTVLEYYNRYGSNLFDEKFGLSPSSMTAITDALNVNNTEEALPAGEPEPIKESPYLKLTDDRDSNNALVEQYRQQNPGADSVTVQTANGDLRVIKFDPASVKDTEVPRGATLEKNRPDNAQEVGEYLEGLKPEPLESIETTPVNKAFENVSKISALLNSPQLNGRIRYALDKQDPEALDSLILSMEKSFPEKPELRDSLISELKVLKESIWGQR